MASWTVVSIANTFATFGIKSCKFFHPLINIGRVAAITVIDWLILSQVDKSLSPNQVFNNPFPEENTLVNVDIPEIPVAPVEEVVEEEKEEVEETPIDNKIDDILLKDFSENNKNIEALSNAEEPKEEVSVEDNITLNPINNVSSIEEPKEEVPVEPVKKEESVYKNDKKLSDIFKKKTDAPAPATNLETTADYSTELDRILQKLNEASSDITDDSTLEETTDFTNMF